jgi:ribosomal protein L2
VRFALPSFQESKANYETFRRDKGLQQLEGVASEITPPHSQDEKSGRLPSEELPPPPSKRSKEGVTELNASQVATSISSTSESVAQLVTSIRHQTEHEQQPQVHKSSSPHIAMSGKKVTEHHTSTLQSRRNDHERLGIPIDLNREKLDMPATVVSITHDDRYHRFIAFLRYKDGEERHIFAPEGLKEGDEVISSDASSQLSVGCTTRLKNLPIGSTIHCIEEIPGGGAKFATSSGMSAKLLSKEGRGALLQMPSGRKFLLDHLCRATIGVVRK